MGCAVCIKQAEFFFIFIFFPLPTMDILCSSPIATWLMLSIAFDAEGKS